jgi:demethylmenaquinone methyltransferase/2-methoxy-6-polyprenyl-1,4-benzoquinol methylase
MDSALDNLLAEQVGYYRARAPEYDQWFLRQGRYDGEPARNAQWFAEAATVERALAALAPAGRVLELACGTGLWTRHLAESASHLTAVDISPEVLALNRARLGERPVEYVEADLFHWEPAAPYDLVFFSFWLSHVPPERFDAFWEGLRRWLTPAGRIFMIDSLGLEEPTRPPAAGDPADAVTTTRRLNDGREFTIIKIFYEPGALSRRLAALGWRASLQGTAHHFLYGSAAPE